MVNLPCQFAATENKIIILRPVKGLPVFAGLLHQRPFHHQEMADIVVGAQEIRVKIRFKMRLKKSSGIKAYLILIRIDHIRFRMGLQPFDHFKQGMPFQKIIMIQKRHILSCSKIQRCIGISRNAQVLRKLFIADSGILCRVIFQNLLRSVVFLTSVCQTEFHISIGLSQYGVYHLPQESLRCLINRNHHADLRRIGKAMLPLQLFFAVSRPLGDHPLLIIFFQNVPFQAFSCFQI